MNSTQSPGRGARRFWTDNAALGLATVVAGLFNTAYSVLLAHALGPGNYGRIGALNSLVSLFLLPLPIIGLAAIRFGRQKQQHYLTGATLALGVLIFLMALMLSASFGRGLHLSPTLIVLYSSSVVLNFGYALYIGFLERARRYPLVGGLLVLASALGVASVVLAVTLGRQHPLTWLGIWQAATVAVVFLLARHWVEEIPVIPPSRLKPAVVATTLGVGTLQALWGLADTLFAKAHLSTVDAGLYTGLSTIGQALPFMVSSLATVMLTAVLDDPERRRYYLVRTLVASTGVALLYTAVLHAFPVTVVRVALGPAFVPMAALIQRYSGAMAALALVLVLATYGVAVGMYRTMIAAAVGTGVWIVLLAGAHSMATLVNRTLEAMVGTLAAVILVFLLTQERNRPLG